MVFKWCLQEMVLTLILDSGKHLINLYIDKHTITTKIVVHVMWFDWHCGLDFLTIWMQFVHLNLEKYNRSLGTNSPKITQPCSLCYLFTILCFLSQLTFLSLFCTVQCTLNIVQCTLHGVFYTLCCVLWAVYRIPWCTVYTTFFSLYTVHDKIFGVHYTVCHLVCWKSITLNYTRKSKLESLQNKYKKCEAQHLITSVI